jgi:hypothetical protein
MPVVVDTASQAADTLVGDADDDYLPPMEDSLSLGCTPKSFGPRDTLTLRMETPHGGEMVLTTPDHITYELVYGQPIEGKKNYSLAPIEAFKSMSMLKVSADIRMPPSVYGRDTAETVFSQPGQYVIAMGVNLHSDHADRPYICRVTFLPR